MYILALIIYLVAIIGILGITATTAVHYRTKSVALFSAFSLVLALWLLGQFLAQYLNIEGVLSLRLLQLSSAVSSYLAYLFLLFVFDYIDILESRRRFIKYALIIPPLLFTPLNFTGLMISSVTVSNEGIAIEEAGNFYFVQIAIIVLYFLISIFALAKNTFQKPPMFRTKNYLLIFGFFQAITISVLASTIFAAYAASQVFIPVSLACMVAIVSVAIIKHRLFDIRLIVARSVAYVLSFSTLGVLFALGVFAISNYIFNNSAISASINLTYTAIAILLAFTLQPIKRFFDRVTNSIFYRDAYDTQAFLDELNRSLVATTDFEELLKKCAVTIGENIKSEYCAFVVSHKGERQEIISDNDLTNFKSPFLMQYDFNTERILMTDDINEVEQSKLKIKLMESNISLAAALMVTDKESPSFLILGPKRSGNPYSSADKKVIELITDEMVIAMQNALRFEEIENFNITLQKKIDQATAELRKTNEKLKALDQAKDDFISMASHQLRTPLTSVKGYVSMVLEGDAGPLNKTQQKLLEQSFTSSQRMVYLIADLLNVSRLRTGKFVIEATPTYLPDVVEAELSQLLETAKSRQLELTFERPESFPTLMLDQTKVRQVIMNFVDNAIYYTEPGGKITVSLKELPKSVELTVVDNGIGVPKAEQHHLFTKFYRANNAKKARPDGTGLGLFMAKKVIIAQGGAIIFKSQEGKGSTFGFTFPKNKLETDETAITQL